MESSPNTLPRGKRPRNPQDEEVLPDDEVPPHPEDHDNDERSAKVARLPAGDILPSAPDLPALSPISITELPLAPRLKDYLAPGGILRYRPRPEWYRVKIEKKQKDHAPSPSQASWGTLQPPQIPSFAHAEAENASELPSSRMNMNMNTSRSMETSPTEPPVKPAVFGKDWDHAIHVAIRENATDCALQLLDYGVPLEVENAKRFTPLILAAQKGNPFLVRELLHRGADPTATTLTGVSAVLQAAHFGRYRALQLLLHQATTATATFSQSTGSNNRDNNDMPLIEMANYNHTTPLMRASQEGHVDIVQLLLKAGANVNRRNRAHLTALMLASQRGHANVCQCLIEHGAELDAATHQNSTSLLLACKRGHTAVVQVLVTAGCELSVKDSRGRTVRQVVERRESQKELAELLDPAVQVDLMRRQGRRKRNWEMVKIWHLLQKERANLLVPDEPAAVGIHEVPAFLERPELLPYCYTVKSTTALLRAMTLPEPLVETIAQFLPLPYLWEKRIGMLAKRAAVNADDAVSGALDLMDEILEEGGFLEALDAAQVPPPLLFTQWSDWKAWGRQKGRVAATDWGPERLDLTTATCPPPRNVDEPTFCEWRRHAGFLQILSQRPPLLESILTKPPFKIPSALLEMLSKVSDVASLTRRMVGRGVHFDIAVAMDMVMLASQLCSWYWRERDEA